MSVFARTRLLLLVAVLVLGAAMWLVNGQQREALLAAQAQTAAAGDLLTAMLDQETAVRGFDQTGLEEFLAPFHAGRSSFAATMRRAEAAAAGDPELRALLRSQRELAETWEAAADQAVARVRAEGAHALEVPGARGRKALMDRFRIDNARLRTLARARADRGLASARWTAVGLVVLIGAGLVGGGLLVIERSSRAHARRRQAEREFADALQGADDEREAQQLLRRHVERTVPGSAAVVLSRTVSGNQLAPATDPGAVDPVAGRLEGARPRDCLAVRRGGAYARASGTEPLQPCTLCGDLPGESLCTPSLVGGEVIGSVLVTHPRRIGAVQRGSVGAAVTLAAPVLANLRNLALAEHRAATDALTGLPNARVVHDTLTRSVAQAGRSSSPLTAIALDLDHFKAINDTYGHPVGDEVLEAVGTVLRRTIRASDFAGRWGGVEFVVLLPDTDAAGGARLAEKLRAEIAGVIVPGARVAISASLGVASVPEHAGSAQDLIRAADRALYAAKAAGRDRVVSAGDVPTDS